MRELTAASPFLDTMSSIPDFDSRFALRQADQVRTDIANLECGQELLMQQMARLPTRSDLARAAFGVIGVIFAAAGLVIGWIELFPR
jgi:hypothetical protein